MPYQNRSLFFDPKRWAVFWSLKSQGPLKWRKNVNDCLRSLVDSIGTTPEPLFCGFTLSLIELFLLYLKRTFFIIKKLLVGSFFNETKAAVLIVNIFLTEQRVLFLSWMFF
jgi:hypothetical protein